MNCDDPWTQAVAFELLRHVSRSRSPHCHAEWLEQVAELSASDFVRNLAKHIYHHRYCRIAMSTERVALGDPGRVVVAQPNFTFGVFPDQRLERQVNAGRLLILHQSTTPFPISTNDPLP